MNEKIEKVIALIKKGHPEKIREATSILEGMKTKEVAKQEPKKEIEYETSVISGIFSKK